MKPSYLSRKHLCTPLGNTEMKDIDIAIGDIRELDNSILADRRPRRKGKKVFFKDIEPRYLGFCQYRYMIGGNHVPAFRKGLYNHDCII